MRLQIAFVKSLVLEASMRVTAISLLLLLSAPQQAFCWGQEGHSIIAEIAQRRLTKEAADAIAKVLAPQPGAPVLSLPSFASFASWTDDHRENHPETGPWHFIDGPLHDMLDLKRDCPENKGCVVSKLESLRNDLRCGSNNAGKANALNSHPSRRRRASTLSHGQGRVRRQRHPRAHVDPRKYLQEGLSSTTMNGRTSTRSGTSP